MVTLTTIEEDAEKILKDAIFLHTKVEEKGISNEEISEMLKDIISLSNKILSEDREAMRRVLADLTRVFRSEEQTKKKLRSVGLDLQKVFNPK